MLAALAAAALIVAASLTVGLAALTLCGRREDRVAAGPVGLALLLAASAIVAGLGGRGAAIAIVLAAITALAAAVIARAGMPEVEPGARATAVAAGLAAGLAAAIPFIAAGTVGILGVGLVNDDMASHLLLADWIDERFRPEPRLVDQGYPLGPHALVAGVGDLLGARSIDVFAGLVLAIPALTAFMVSGVLEARRPWIRVLCATLVALPYLAAAYLAQEAFKEPILALFVLAFALLLPSIRAREGEPAIPWPPAMAPRAAIPFGLVAAGAVYVYSFPGLAWLVGTLALWLALALLALRRLPTIRIIPRPAIVRPALRQTSIAMLGALAMLAVLIAPELPRLWEFADFRALDPDRANEGGLGNLRRHISPLEALGIWPTSEFRLSAGAGALPAVAFYAGAALAATAFALALPRWLRRHGPAIPAALLTAVALYVVARAFGTVYTSAKALAIAAPLITLITLGGLLGGASKEEGRSGGRRRRLRSTDARTQASMDAEASPTGTARPSPALALLATAVLAAGALSSFLILRQAPVGPEDHMDELAEIRPTVEGEKLLFLGRDNFILYELRGSKPFTHVRNFYDPYFVRPNLELRDVFSKFDFDAVTAEKLARFRYVLTTRAAYASGPPPSYEPIAETESYVLWEKRGPVGDRRPGETGPEPGRLGGCDPPVDRAAVLPAPPVVAGEWTSTTVEDGAPGAIEIRLPPGAWELSLQYDSTRPLTLSAPGFEVELPANLDYRGTAPFWHAGAIELDRETTVAITAEVERPPLAGRVLGASSVAHLGRIAATPAADAAILRHRSACRGYVDWYVR